MRGGSDGEIGFEDGVTDVGDIVVVLGVNRLRFGGGGSWKCSSSATAIRSSCSGSFIMSTCFLFVIFNGESSVPCGE